uniref:Uncharacterized protein n=1 Tax=Ananas comosus var. bracteatus TaxID=296719 RepID=A0A6V7QI94_ANACO|nr:unnamed protein product [Ananas comosus var. bracteatus]
MGNPSRPLPTGDFFEPVLLGDGDGRGLPVWNPDLYATLGSPGAAAAMGSCAGAPLGTGLPNLYATRGSPGAAAAMGSCAGAPLGMGLLLRTGRSRDLAEALSAPNPPEGGDGEEAGGTGYLPSVRRGATRSSPRVRDPANISALERAKRRKAILLEGAISSSAKLARKWSSKKVDVFTLDT